MNAKMSLKIQWRLITPYLPGETPSTKLPQVKVAFKAYGHIIPYRSFLTGIPNI